MFEYEILVRSSDHDMAKLNCNEIISRSVPNITLIPFKISFMVLRRWSLRASCCDWYLRVRSDRLQFTGIRTRMMATPTRKDKPSLLYRK